MTSIGTLDKAGSIAADAFGFVPGPRVEAVDVGCPLWVAEASLELLKRKNVLNFDTKIEKLIAIAQLCDKWMTEMFWGSR